MKDGTGRASCCTRRSRPSWAAYRLQDRAALRGERGPEEGVGGVPRADAEPRADRARASSSELGLDPETETPGRLVVRHIGESLVKAMEMALDAGHAGGGRSSWPPSASCCAETKDHLNWELIGEVAEEAQGRAGQGAEGSAQGGRGRGGRAPLPHHGLDPRAVDRVARACPPCCRRPRRRRK